MNNETNPRRTIDMQREMVNKENGKVCEKINMNIQNNNYDALLQAFSTRETCDMCTETFIKMLRMAFGVIKFIY